MGEPILDRLYKEKKKTLATNSDNQAVVTL